MKSLVALLFFVASAVCAQMPQRIISLDLCTDWMLALHVERSRVAALSPMQRDKQRFHPAPWMKNDWPTHDASLESIALLQPDIILTGQYNAVLLRAQLIRLGYRVEVLPLPATPEDVRDYEQRFFALVGQPAHFSVPPPARPSGNQRLLLLGANAIGTGKETFEDALLTRAGWHNYLTESGLVRLDLEKIAQDPPDAVLWAAPVGAALANSFAEHSLWRAINSRRLNTDYWRWQCPGPWSWELVEELDLLRKKIQ